MKSEAQPEAKGIWEKAAFGLLALMLAVSFFADVAGSSDRVQWLRTVTWEFRAACRDPATQWMVALCLLSYFVTFMILARRSIPSSESAEESERHACVNTPSPRPGVLAALASNKSLALRAFLRRNLREPDFWLSAFLVLALARYGIGYEAAAKSPQLVVLLAGVVLGKATAVYARGPIRRPMVTVSSDWSGAATRVRKILGFLLALLTVAAFWRREDGLRYEYRGVPRWTGPWDNPNLYGLLMGTGLVLALGLLASNLSARNPGSRRANHQPDQFRKWAGALLYLVAAAVCGFGLAKSYSRGAWLGAACGLGYLVWQIAVRLRMNLPSPSVGTRPDLVQEFKARPLARGIFSSAGRGGEGVTFSTHKRFQVLLSGCNSWLHRHWISVVVMLFSACVLAFWQFRHTQAPLARRVFSVANVNDFSWRNRVTAWQGSVRMMLRHPLLGVGWSQVEQRFREDFRPERLEETAAVQLNDYFTIANSAGIPALACLLACFAVALNFGFPGKSPPLGCTTDGAGRRLRALCRSVVLLLLIGFWFDGGLFKLPTAAVFWVLLGLVQGCAPCAGDPAEVRRVTPGKAALATGTLPQRAGAIAWLAAFLAALALGRTAMHWVAPQLPVSARTIEVARRYLLTPDETPDFDYLLAGTNWQGQKLKALLEHAQLAPYNRSLVQWKLADEIYLRFVLSPEVSPEFDRSRGWRRILWEHFYPRIRRVQTPMEAARIVLAEISQRLVVSGTTNRWAGIPEIWRQRVTSQEGFAALCVAALRSVGVPARLNSAGWAEWWDGSGWKQVELPIPVPR